MKKENLKSKAAKRDVPTSVDDYLATVPDEPRKALQELRRVLKTIVPESVEVISYQIPTIRYQNRGLVAFSAHKNHCSLHLMSKSIMKKYESELESFETTKASIHFTATKPLSPSLVKKLVTARIEENRSKKVKE